MAFMMNKLVMINSCEIIIEKNPFFAKNHCEIQVRTILVYTLYSIKYGKLLVMCNTIVTNSTLNHVIRGFESCFQSKGQKMAKKVLRPYF